MHRHARRGLAAVLVAATLAPLTTVARADAAEPASAPAAARAVTWLRTQQLDDGSFDAPFTFDGTVFPASDFATSETVLALAEQAQTGPGWSTAQALLAVAGTTRNGASPLRFIDAQSSPTMSAGRAAKFIYLVAAPLGLDPRAFDPVGDGAVDLVAAMDAGLRPDGSYAAGAINATNLAVLANAVLRRPIDPRTIAYLRNAQQANGGWSFSGSPSGSGVEVDTTARTIQALIAAGVPANDPAIERGLALLAAAQRPDGGWGGDGDDRVASTALATIAIEAAGWSPSSPCWRNRLAPALRSRAYVTPEAFIRSQQQPDGSMRSPFGAGFTTAQGVQALTRHWQPTNPAPARCLTTGYRVVARDGSVFAYGSAGYQGGANGQSAAPVVAALGTPTGGGYWLIGADGGVFAYGDARFHGSAATLRLAAPIVAAAPTPTGGGYWLIGADGGVFAYGDARFHGSAATLRLAAPIVAAAPTPTGGGYWLVGADGGVFAYGDARFHGSAAGVSRARVVAGAATPGGDGYWLVGADGGVFAYGDARFHGSAAGVTRAPAVALVP